MSARLTVLTTMVIGMVGCSSAGDVNAPNKEHVTDTGNDEATGDDVGDGDGDDADDDVTARQNYNLAADYSTSFGGHGVLVMKDGVIVFERYEGEFTGDSAQHLHSATKSFWGLAAAAMVDEGLLSSFDELAKDTISEWAGDDRSVITVRQLLNLTDGQIEDMRQLHPQTTGADDKYAYAITLPLVTEPGTHFRYGPSHFYSFGELMNRKVASLELDTYTYLQSRILDPLGISPQSWTRDVAGDVNMPNGAYFTMHEWVKYGQLVLQEGIWRGVQIVSADLLHQVLTGSEANLGYGVTFWLNRPGGLDVGGTPGPLGAPGGWVYPWGLPDLAGAMGAGKNRMYIVPSRGLVIARMSETENDMFSDCEFLRILFGEYPQDQTVCPTSSDGGGGI